MKSITMLYPAMEAHKTGCQDIQRSLSKGQTKRREQVDTSEVFEGERYSDVVLKIDQESAAGFGEVFDPDGEYDSQPWLITDGTVHLAPCLKGRVNPSTIDRAVQKQRASLYEDRFGIPPDWTEVEES